MFALTALIVIGIWGGIGFAIWRFLILPHLRSPIINIGVTFILVLLWFVGPVIDEILGAREFDHLCREMPSIKYYGPVAVGPGEFFDEKGQPKWKNKDEFSAIERNTGGTYNFISSKTDWRHICELPIPIVEKHTVYFEKSTGAFVVETFARYSEGGWIRRLIGFGDYQCPSKGRFPSNEELIIFKQRI